MITDEQIREIAEDCSVHVALHQTISDLDDALEKMIHRAIELHEKSKWISVDDEMPNYYRNRQVIAFMPSAYQKIRVVTVYNDGKGGSAFPDGWRKGERYEITKWQPLPPKPETDENS